MMYSISSNNQQDQAAIHADIQLNQLAGAVPEGAASEPTISVVIPLYNKREEVIATIESVLAQTVLPLEILVIDDGSTDDSAVQVKGHFADRVKLIQQCNGGVSAARNRGIAEARGDYIALLDADDFWASHYLEEILQLAKAFPQAGTLATCYQYLDGEQQYVNPKIRFGKNFFKPALMDNYFAIASKGDLPFNASSVVIKKGLLDALQGFPLNEPMGEDQDVWSRAALRAPVAYSPKVLSFYNRGAQNRACATRPPSAECPFSRRLYTYATNANITLSTRNAIIDYTVTHLIQLAERNIEFGDVVAAKALLNDYRCKRKPFKLLRARARLLWATLKAAVSMQFGNAGTQMTMEGV